MKPKAGYIDIDECRDLRKDEHITKIDVYEDIDLKSRPIGFIWPDNQRIDLSETKTLSKMSKS